MFAASPAPRMARLTPAMLTRPDLTAAAVAGRAAQRMGSIQGIEPSTIHRLLGYQPRGSLGGVGGGGGGSLPDPDAAADEAEAQGVFQFNRWAGRVPLCLEGYGGKRGAVLVG